MKRITLALAILIALALTNCASSTTDATGAARTAMVMTPQLRAAIDVVRPIGRIGIQVALSSKAVPAAVSTGAIAVLDQIIDAFLNGDNFAAIGDPVAWKPVRDKLVASGTSALSKALNKGGTAGMFDDATLGGFAAAFIDTSAAQIRLVISNQRAKRG